MSLVKRIHDRLAGSIVGRVDPNARRDVMRAVLEAMQCSAERLGRNKADNLYYIEVGWGWSRDLPSTEDIKDYLADEAARLNPPLEFEGTLQVELWRVPGQHGPTVESYVGASRRTVPRMEAALVFAGDGEQALRVEIPGEVTVGSPGQGGTEPRLALNEQGEALALVPSPEGDVSRRHARIAMTGPDAFQIADLGSKNGTQVNRTRLKADEPHALQHGDVVTMGSVSFVFDRLLPIEAKVASRQGVLERFEVRLSNQQEWRIGRGADCEITIGAYAGDVSKLHASVAYGPGGYWLRDLGSRNGTRVMRGQQSISVSGDDEVLLRHEDEIVLGKELSLVYLEE